MRLGIFSDVHANIEALTAVMEGLRHDLQAPAVDDAKLSIPENSYNHEEYGDKSSVIQQEWGS